MNEKSESMTIQKVLEMFYWGRYILVQKAKQLLYLSTPVGVGAYQILNVLSSFERI